MYLSGEYICTSCDSRKYQEVVFSWVTLPSTSLYVYIRFKTLCRHMYNCGDVVSKLSEMNIFSCYRRVVHIFLTVCLMFCDPRCFQSSSRRILNCEWKWDVFLHKQDEPWKQFGQWYQLHLGYLNWCFISCITFDMVCMSIGTTRTSASGCSLFSFTGTLRYMNKMSDVGKRGPSCVFAKQFPECNEWAMSAQVLASRQVLVYRR